MYELEIIIALSAVLTGWYFIGLRMNRRLTERVWKSILEQLEDYTPSVTARELGTSGFIAVADSPRGAFTRMEMAFVCLPRDILINYIVSKAIGRLDLFSLKGDVKNPKDLTGKIKDLDKLVLRYSVKTTKPHVTLVLSAEQVLKGNLKEALKVVERALS